MGLALLAACGGGDDGGKTQDIDAAVSGDAAVDSTQQVDGAAGGTTMWQLGSTDVCTPTVAINCGDGGATAGYQLAASANCPLQSLFQFYLPGGSVPASGTYTVKPVSAPADATNLTSGQIAARIIHFSSSTGPQESWWAQDGTATVVNSGGHLTVTLDGSVTAKIEGNTTTMTMTATAACP